MQKILFLSSFLPASIFTFASFFIGFRNPDTFDAPTLVLNSPIPALLFFLTICMVIIFSQKQPILRENLPGLILFFLFVLGYFMIASILNKPEVNTNNIYFAADNGSWYQRMAAEDGWNTGTRGVHPLVHIIFRPLIAILALLTAGDRFYAILILLSITGSGCVLLMWKIVMQVTGSKSYSILSASLLGLSASHLIFASIIETYIFSAFCLLLFVWLLLINKPSWLIIITSTATLGITITNVIQQVLTFFFLRKDIKQLLKIFSFILVISISLNLVSKAFYPVTEYFFLPQNLTSEKRFSQEISANRFGLMIENLLLYNIVAPQPYISMRNEMPRFNFLPGTIQNYIWFGLPAFVSWLIVLIIGFVSIPFVYKYSQVLFRLTIALLTCLLINFALHISYGVEPFLYSADWTYALLLVIVIGLQNIAQKTWFIVGWLLLAIFVTINNLWFIYLISKQVSGFIS